MCVLGGVGDQFNRTDPDGVLDRWKKMQIFSKAPEIQKEIEPETQNGHT